MGVNVRKYIPLSYLLLAVLSISFLITAARVTFSQTQQTNINFYEKGLEEKKNKNFQEALDIWYQAKTTLDEPDFRIAQEYLKLVTGQKLKQYYQKATEIYYWGLSGKLSKVEQENLLKEITLLNPLLNNRDYRDFKKKIEERNSEALSEIKNVWDNLDPTPLNTYNERLIEHWERISYARNNYSSPNQNELDDRAYIYIKYGEPYYSKDGQLSYQQSLVYELLRQGIKTPSFGTANDRAVANAQRYNLETRVRQLHSYPHYEVWIYPDLTDSNENTIFIFSSQNGSNEYEKIKSIEDFIPSEAYRNQGQHNFSLSGSRGVSGINNSDGSSDVQFDASRESLNNAEQVTINPALILQLMYYQQFSALDQYFGSSFDDMMDRYISISNSTNSNMSQLAREFGTMYGNELVQRENAAPEEKSEDKSEIFSIPTEQYVYRFLDEDNKPYVKTYSVIYFTEALYYDLLKDTNSLQTGISDKYTLVNGYVLKSEQNTIVSKDTSQNTINSTKKIVNTFEIPYESSSQSLILSHELHKKSQLEDSNISQNTAYPRSLIALSNINTELPEPLDSEGLLLSDLIIGYSKPSDEISYSSDTLNFNIAHDKVIPVGSDLYLYYELYNLHPAESDEISKFTSHYKIRKESKVLGIFKKFSGDDTGITINNTVSDDRFNNVLSIKTSTLEEGKYHLDIEIEDQNSDQEIFKTLKFYIK